MADEKGISISEFICSSCEDIAKKKIEKDIQKEKMSITAISGKLSAHRRKGSAIGRLPF